jgi:site-specific DNA-methyltransferase (adenine-specific)
VWRLAPERGSEHPAPFPKELPARAIEATDAATVFDPFCGSGSTLIAALDHGKRAMGCEIDEKWVDIAVKRLERWHAQGRLELQYVNH